MNADEWIQAQNAHDQTYGDPDFLTTPEDVAWLEGRGFVLRQEDGQVEWVRDRVVVAPAGGGYWHGPAAKWAPSPEIALGDGNPMELDVEASRNGRAFRTGKDARNEAARFAWMVKGGVR